MRKTPSPRSGQLVIGIALLALGWASIMLSVRYDLLVPPSLALEVTGGALLLVGVAMRILAFKEIPSTYHIKGLVISGVYAKTRNPVYLGFILMIVGVAVFSRGVLAFIWALSAFSFSIGSPEAEKAIWSGFLASVIYYTRAPSQCFSLDSGIRRKCHHSAKRREIMTRCTVKAHSCAQN
jgi:protein-S-isoprenylcysteine O-methyltransferase Ste14